MQRNLFTSRNSIYVRLLLFSILFVFVTGITGPFIIRTPLLYSFFFFIYGNIGKLVLFSCVVIFLLFRNKKLMLKPIRNSLIHMTYIGIGSFLIPIFFVLANQLLKYPSFSGNIFLSLITHVILIAIPIFFAFGIFTPYFISEFFLKFRKLIGVGIVIGIFYDISIFYIWKLWPFLSNIVLVIMKLVFSLTQQRVFVMPPRTLFVHNFAVTIAEACSGIDSMYLLLTLYLLIVGIDWKILNKTKVIIFFIPLFIGMFLINILRVFILINLGIIFGPRIMLELFHTYLGLVLFLVYFLLFLYFIYPKLKLKMKTKPS